MKPKSLLNSFNYQIVKKLNDFRYGWHFPELGKILTDNVAFIKTIKVVGMRENFSTSELSDILPQDLEEKVKEAAEVSMGELIFFFFDI